MSQKIAIIGSGITGMGAAWHLHHCGYDIDVFEAADRIGGHSNTVSGPAHADVDTGFIVLNEDTYPNFIALLAHIGVETVESDMSFGVSCNEAALEYSSNALFAQKKNIFNPGYIRMLLDVLRFYKNAKRDLKQGDTRSLGEYLRDEHYSDYFIRNHILPMGAAIWSMGVDETGGFPLSTFVTFFDNHGLMKVKNRPIWRTIKGGSRSYVRVLTKDYQDKIHLNTPITSLKRDQAGVTLNNDPSLHYDQVIFACHSDQALTILGNTASDDERAILGDITYSPNIAYLHRDETFMPQRRAAWASWNVLCDDTDDKTAPVTLTYWMNRLQKFINDKDLFVTLNPKSEPKNMLAKIPYAHPCYTKKAVAAQQKLHLIQGPNRSYFCGAWCGYGFHEDGLSAGLHAAEMISGQQRPWPVAAEKSNAKPNMTNHGETTS